MHPVGKDLPEHEATHREDDEEPSLIFNALSQTPAPWCTRYQSCADGHFDPRGRLHSHRCQPAVEPIRTRCQLPVGRQLGLLGRYDQIELGLVTSFPIRGYSLFRSQSQKRPSPCPLSGVLTINPSASMDRRTGQGREVFVGAAIGKSAQIPCDGGAEASRFPSRGQRHGRSVRYSLSTFLGDPADRCSTMRTALLESIPD